MQEIYAGVLQIFRNEFLEFCLNTIFVPFLFEWLVIDICQALDDKMLSYCDNVMTLLLKDLSSGDLPRFVKPSIFSCFGDVALAIGEKFEKYVPYAMPMMQGAAEVCAQIDVYEEEMVEYGSQLKRSISEAYSGILQGFKNSKAELMLPHAPHLVKFMELAIKDTQRLTFYLSSKMATNTL
ncbi:importin subunit beta-1 [Tanacetum coccineum]